MNGTIVNTQRDELPGATKPNYFMGIVSKAFILVFIFLSAKAQKSHTDAKEYGFYGKVKTVVEYDYYAESTVQKDSVYYLTNKDGYKLKRTYFFNRKGNIDSVSTFYTHVIESTGKNINFYNYLIYEFDARGTKTGFKSYSSKRKLIVQGDIKWIDSNHYIQTSYEFKKDGKKSKTEEINFVLTDKFRELSYEIKTFGIVDSTLLMHYTVTNSFSKDGRIEKKQVENKLEAKSYDEETYRYQIYDKMKNPSVTLRFGYDKRLKKYIVTEYSYY